MIPPDYHPQCFTNRCDGVFLQRKGKFGLFYGCSNYPKCRSTRSYESVMREYGEDVLGVVPDDEDLYPDFW